MRITDEMTYGMLSSNISRNQAEIYNIQAMMASGKKVNVASDDPAAFETITRLHADSSNIEQYMKNAEQANRDLLVVEDNLKNIMEIFHRASEIAVTAGDETNSSDDFKAMGEEVNILLESLIGQANTTDRGYYVFAGLRTSQPAYVTTDVGADGYIDTVAYQGSAEVRQSEIGRDVYVDVNIPGTDTVGNNGVFQTNSGVDLFQDLIDMRDTLLSGNSVSATTTLDDIDAGLEHVISTISVVGAREEKIRLSQDFLSFREAGIVSALAEEEDLDIAQAVMELSKKQTAYEASLRAAAGVLNSASLLNYL